MATTEQRDRQMRITMYYGYALFIVTLAVLAVTIFPWFCLYPNDVFQDYDGTLFLLTSVFTALTPPLAGYFVGIAATRDPSKLVRHYNGVLFGVLSLWLWLVFAMVTTVAQWVVVIENNVQYMLLEITPAIVAALTAIVVGVLYARSAQVEKVVIESRLYRVVLFASPIVLIILFGISGLFGLHYGSTLWMTFLINIIIPLLCILVVTLLGYWALGKKSGTVGERIVYSLIAIAYGIAVIMLAGQLSTGYGEWQEFLISTGVSVLALTWATYLYFLRRAAR